MEEKWKLLGWYDSRLKDARKVLEPDGDVVNNAIVDFTGGSVADDALSLNDDVTLYARWSNKVDDVFVEADSLVRNEPVIVAEQSFAFHRKDSLVGVYGIPVSSDGNIEGANPGLALPSKFTPPNDLLWIIDDQGRLNSVSDSTRFVAANLKENLFRLGANNNGKNIVTWNWDSDNKSLQCAQYADVRFVPDVNKSEMKDLSWVASSDTSQPAAYIRIFKKGEAWELTWERPWQP